MEAAIVLTNSTISEGGIDRGNLFRNIYAAVLLSIFLVGLLGNLLVIYVVGRFSCMQTVTNIHLLSLSIADTLYLLSMPIFLFTILGRSGFPFGHFMCKVFWFLTTVNWFAGTFALTAMSADRYMAILHPFRAQSIRTPRNTCALVLLLWILSIIIMVPTFVNARVNTLEINNSTQCSENWSVHSETPMIAFTMYTFAFGYLIPCVLIVVFYSMVIYRMRTAGPENKSKEKRECQKKATRLVLAVILVYVFCWLPYWINQLRLFPRWKQYYELSSNPTASNETVIYASTMSPYVELVMSHIVQLLCYINSAVNPILYSFMSQNFRKSFQRVFACQKMENIFGDASTTAYNRRRDTSQKTQKNVLLDTPNEQEMTKLTDPTPFEAREDVERKPWVSLLLNNNNSHGGHCNNEIIYVDSVQETEIN